MDSRSTDKTDDPAVAETPEDVAVLYSWANLHGAKYRDFSASRREYRAMCDIPPDIQKDDLDRRLKVFGGGHFGVAPAIRLHGVEFRAVLPPEEQATALSKSA